MDSLTPEERKAFTEHKKKHPGVFAQGEVAQDGWNREAGYRKKDAAHDATAEPESWYSWATSRLPTFGITSQGGGKTLKKRKRKKLKRSKTKRAKTRKKRKQTRRRQVMRSITGSGLPP